MAEIIQTTSILSSKDHWDHILARCGVRRSQHRIQPGLYALGKPDRDALVFVTANYTLSFDALRSTLLGRDAYILLLDTKGVNVWCAAGEGNFGTDELVSRIESTGLEKIVDHRHLILPQLGATGVSAHLVKQYSGFEVEYGPIRAEDLPQYLKEHQATAEMRRVRFNLNDRMILVPVEMVNSFLPMALIAGVLFLLGGWFNLLWVLSAWLACSVILFALLPWIPGREFSIKGFILGMEHDKLKQEFGNRLSFHGGMDIQNVLPFGSPQEVTSEAIKVMNSLGRDGGYILSPTHYLLADVPPENILALRDAVLKSGNYPLPGS